MTKSVGLLAQLQAITVRLPEADCFVPEWDRSITFRSMTVGEGRAMEKARGKEEEDGDGRTLSLVAYSIIDGDERPLANPEGIALLEALSQRTLIKLIDCLNELYGNKGEEKNSETMPPGESSTDSQGISEGQSLN